MAGTGAFKLEGVVIEARANGTYQVLLANGHRLLGFVAGKARHTHTRFVPGAKVKLNLSPCDLSQGRIIVEEKENL